MGTETRLLSIDQAAQYWGISARMVRTWVTAGRVQIVRLGRRVLLDKERLDELIQCQTQRGEVTRQAVEGEQRIERQTRP